MLRKWRRNIMSGNPAIVFTIQPTWNVTPNDFKAMVTKSGATLKWDMGDGTTYESNTIDHDYGTTDPQTIRLFIDDYATITHFCFGNANNDDFDGMLKNWPLKLANFPNLQEWDVVFTDQSPTPNDYSFQGSDNFPASLIKYHQKRGSLKAALDSVDLQDVYLYEVDLGVTSVNIPSSIVKLLIVADATLSSISFSGLSNLTDLELTLLPAFEGTIPSFGLSCTKLKLRQVGGSGAGITLTNLNSGLLDLQLYEAELNNLPSLPSTLVKLEIKDLTVTFPTLVSSIQELIVDGHWVTSANLNNCTGLLIFNLTNAVLPAISSFTFPSPLESLRWVNVDFTSWSGTSFALGGSHETLDIQDVVNTGPGDDFDFTSAVSSLTYIRMQNCGLSQADVDSYITQIYDNRASFPLNASTNKLIINNGGSGLQLNASPSGTYQAPSGYVQGDAVNVPNDGTPANSLEKLYVLVNQTDQSEDKKYNWEVYYA